MGRHTIAFLVMIVTTTWAAEPYQPSQPDPVLESWRWRFFPEVDGRGLRCVAEDRTGAMWFGIDTGVMRYDGITWTTYTTEDGLYGSPVNVLLAARDGSVYAGTEIGLSRFSDGTWQRIFPPSGDLPWPISSMIEASDGSVWAGTGWGALRLNRGSATIYTPRETASALQKLAPYVNASIVPDHAVAIDSPSRPNIGVGISSAGWLMSVHPGPRPHVINTLAVGGAGEMNGLTIGDRILTENGVPFEFTATYVNKPAETSAVFEVQRGGLPEPLEVTLKYELLGNHVRFPGVDGIFEDREGKIWFGWQDGSIGWCDLRKATQGDPAAWKIYSKADHPTFGNRQFFAQTPDGAIWVANADSRFEINRFSEGAWTHISPTRTTVGNHAILVTRDATLWVGGGLFALRDSEWHAYQSTLNIPYPSHRTRLLEASDGALWIIGLGQEAARLDLSKSKWVTYEGLKFQAETSDGAQWFVSRDSGVVRYVPSSGKWVRYGVEDGLMDRPTSLIVTQSGTIWAAGAHKGVSATAQLLSPSASTGHQWQRQTHPQISRFTAIQQIYEFADGNIWFRTAHDAGRFNGQSWYYTPAVGVYGMGQTADGTVWAGGYGGLRRYDGHSWTRFAPRGVRSTIGTLHSDSNGELWLGYRLYGIMHYDGHTWTSYNVQNGLAHNRIRSILRANDGSVWAATDKGISRFDGRSWTTHALPPDLLGGRRTRPLNQSQDGALWLNLGTPTRIIKTIRYKPDTIPPETKIKIPLEEVSQPGNTTITWEGTAPWKATPDSELQYAYRLDGEDWSAFSKDTQKTLLALSSGNHTFEVKSRDRDFNEDPTPAMVQFTVIPPVWQQPWFIGLMVVAIGIIIVQASRIVARDRRLQEGNKALSSANHDLFDLNKDLQQKTEDLERGRAMERIRGEVQSMRQAADFEKSLSVLGEDLNTVGLSFDTCGIDVLEEPVDNPSMPHFETNGFNYTTYTIDPKGEVLQRPYALTAPFPEVIEETLTRFIAGEPWQGTSSGTAIVEVPIAQYGRLRLTASERQTFTDEEINTLNDFASAIALGYTRYLDFVNLETANTEIQIQTDRKSEFLASMSHELRTPLTAIRGYIDNMLDGITGELTERQTRNLTRVGQNSDHLLELINNLLDLTKIEAGRMDVEVAPFSIENLITTCCDTIEPLVKSGVELKKEVSEGADDASTDEAKLRHVIGNLLSNAVKFTDEGEIAVRARTVQDQLLISVSDTGIGMPPESLDTIFDEFQQVKGSNAGHKGTGLGLAIVRHYTELLSGTVSVESQIGQGTTFTIQIPKQLSVQ